MFAPQASLEVAYSVEFLNFVHNCWHCPSDFPGTSGRKTLQTEGPSRDRASRADESILSPRHRAKNTTKRTIKMVRFFHLTRKES